ncbi:MAG: ribonuclease [Proteobacteria bacterium]|nr:ribonuclease [Pseudomonadota bacterium]
MAEWLVEEGIGEHRAVLIERDHIVAARIDWPGSLAAGQIEDAVLIGRHAGSSRGTARFASGEEALVSHLPQGASEGAALRLEVTRAAMAELGRAKLAQARPSNSPPCPAPSLAGTLRHESRPVRIVRRFPGAEWDEIWAEADSGEVVFAGGSLHFAATPAMTVVDVDGSWNPRDLALAAVPPLAAALRRFDLAGNIGIDFPTLEAKSDRRAVDDLLDAALADWPHERTAMNGFGFVQLIARLQRPSLLHRLRADRAGACARLLLRRAEAVEEAGTLLLRCHPAVRAALRQEWLDALGTRTGRVLRLESDPGLAMSAGFAQAVTS